MSSIADDQYGRHGLSLGKALTLLEAAAVLLRIYRGCPYKTSSRLRPRPPGVGSQDRFANPNPQVFDPEALQCGFGVNFYFALANFRKIAGEFLSEF